MKKKIFSIGLVVMLLSSLLLIATPASAANLAWSTQAIPDTLGITNQIVPGAAAGLDVDSLIIASNGDMFCIDTNAGNRVYRSANNGLSWLASAPVLLPSLANATLVDLVVSPSYETDATLFALHGTAPAQVFISTNGGVTFNVLGAALPAANTGVSLAVSPTYSGGTGEVMVGTVHLTAATYGNVYIWGRNGVLTWTATGLTADVTTVAYSPSYGIDNTRVAISTNTTGARLNTLVGTDAAWNITLTVAALLDASINDTGSAVSITGSCIAFPSDFNASLITNRTVYAGTVSNVTDNVWRQSVGTPIAATPLAPLTIVGGTDHAMTSLAYSGTTFAGTLYAGSALGTLVMTSSNPTAVAGVVAWIPTFKAPTGTGMTYVVLANDFATSNRIYVGTSGVDSALSVSDDGGFFYNQAGLIDTNIANINGFQAASATEFFMLTNTGTGLGSIFRTTDAGATWYRVLSVAVTANTSLMRLSNDYANDSTLIFADIAAAPPANFRVSNNSGLSWTARSTPGTVTVADMVVRDSFTFYVADAASSGVQVTPNGGWTWQPAPTPSSLAPGAVCNDIDLDLTTGALLVGLSNGSVALSINNNVSYIPLGSVVVAGGAVIVEFDTNYATNSVLYAADTTGAGVYRYTFGVSVSFLTPIDAGLAAQPADILSAPDGTLYVSDSANASPTTGGITRSITPTGFFVTTERVGNGGIFGDGLTLNDQLSILSMVEGSSIIYAVNNLFFPCIRTYTDTIGTTVAPDVVAPEEGAMVNPATIQITIDPVPGAFSYTVQWNTRADYFGTGATLVGAIAWPLVTTAVLTNIPAGTTIFYRVSIATPVLGPWSASRTLETQLPVAVTTAPAVNIGAVEGGTGVGGWNASLQPTFQWTGIGGATAYEFQLSTVADIDAATADELIVDATGDNALGVVTSYALSAATATLDYGTTYYWRVRATGATSNTDWSIAVAFTTMAEPAPPVEPAEPVTVVQQPDLPDIILVPPDIVIEQAAPLPDIVISPPAVVEEEISPSYIWAIIIIGAVLVIALIVLIIRTRRTV